MIDGGVLPERLIEMINEVNFVEKHSQSSLELTSDRFKFALNFGKRPEFVFSCDNFKLFSTKITLEDREYVTYLLSYKQPLFKSDHESRLKGTTPDAYLFNRYN